MIKVLLLFQEERVYAIQLEYRTEYVRGKKMCEIRQRVIRKEKKRKEKKRTLLRTNIQRKKNLL